MIYKGKYHLKRLETQDFPAVKQIFWEVFNKKVSVSYLRNKYNTSYLGVGYIASIAYENETPVAFYGAIPQKFSNDREGVFVAQACDSFTLKQCQGQGIHYQLAKLSYEFMKEIGIQCVYAFHSENTYYATIKLGWKKHMHLERCSIKVPTLPLAKILNKVGLNATYDLFFKKETPKEALKKLRIDHKERFQQGLTPHFIDYKNSFNNHYFFEANGCILWVKVVAIMMVGFFYAPSEIALQKALSKLKRKALMLGINQILFQIHPESTMASQIKNIVTHKESWLIGYLDFDARINISDFLFTYADLDTY